MLRKKWKGAAMSAREQWERFKAGDWAIVEEWADGVEESLHLEFTTADSAKGKPRERHLDKLARSVSGFANVEGGILVFGIETDGKVLDKSTRIVHVVDCQRFHTEIASRLRDIVVPRVAGVEVASVEDPRQSGEGVVAVYVPASSHGPHRAAMKSDGVKGKYYMRTTRSTDVMPHGILAAMFGRPPVPRVRLVVHWQRRYVIQLAVRNLGPGWADDMLIRLAAQGTDGQPLAWTAGGDSQVRALGWTNRRHPGDAGEFEFHRGLPTSHVGLPPDDEWTLGQLQIPDSPLLPAPKRVELSGRIDVRGAPPIRFAHVVEVNAEVLLPDEGMD